ncbi:hypothetical protein Tsubulata_012435 [Turnera subulata]|uniref:Methyltransferase domain-containing protein n=1 Tax=Turnera subulata TaxID=218843 RepID=A0A9Q0GLF6_9ROSI|nr:hypothetical protein Tsubulata_012435 [Turnera subulata]
MAGHCKYSCTTAAETLEWITAIIAFIEPYHSLINSHVVNFFSHRLWESLDQQWIDCLRHEPVQNLLLIPSGVVQDHWPLSLKQFVSTLKSLALPRHQTNLSKVFPGMETTPLNSVLAQGMNSKKKHEVEILSALVSSVANSVGGQTIVDVGAGQGYLAQVLSFQYRHQVVAIDACSHHGNVTNSRAERIKKHYMAQSRKSGSGNGIPNVPKTITGRVMSIEMLKELSGMSLRDDSVEQPEVIQKVEESEASLVLAGLHACGNLSITMLKTFSECENVKAVISIGCCYNLLSEACFDTFGSQCGFPVSGGVKSTGIALGKSARDLACQVLYKYYPKVATNTPSIGRQGKALRRQHQRKVLELSLNREESECSSLSHEVSNVKTSSVSLQPVESDKDENSGWLLNANTLSHGDYCNGNIQHEATAEADKYVLFEKFSESGLSRLGLKPLHEIDFWGIWKEAEPFAELIGPYWSLRAAFGPLLETLLLLDRLLFLQEQGSSYEAVMLPIFDPALSPRNVAIIAKRT